MEICRMGKDTGNSMLHISYLYKNYGKFQAVNNLTLHIPKGDLFGFVGPNGAGKTTTIRIVCGLLPATAGSVYVNGIDAFAHRKAIKRQIGYVPDFFGVYDNLKVKEYLEFYGSMYGMDNADILKVADDLLELVNLQDKKEVYVDTLSRGMKQRLCVARALLHNPKLLILDEPSSGLDPRARVEMKELLMNLNSMGKTIIISSHILSELSEMCTSIGIMNKGQLVMAGKIDDIRDHMNADNRIIFSIEDGIEKAVRIVSEHKGVVVRSVRENELIISHMGTTVELNNIVRQMMEREIILSGFHKEEGNLEALFMQLTGGTPE